MTRNLFRRALVATALSVPLALTAITSASASQPEPDESSTCVVYRPLLGDEALCVTIDWPPVS